jgi:hypothetical protein
LGVTGLSPATVNAVPAAVGRAEPVALGGAAVVDLLARAVGVAGAGPVGVGVVEHPTDSAATAHSPATAAAARATVVI